MTQRDKDTLDLLITIFAAVGMIISTLTLVVLFVVFIGHFL